MVEVYVQRQTNEAIVLLVYAKQATSHEASPI